jgi:hypothetical protein
MTNPQPPSIATLTEAVQEEFVQLWGDLDYACRTARNGSWSVLCDNLAERIVTLSRLVGPTPWGQVSLETVQSGVYERVYGEAGIEFPAVDRARVEQHVEYLRSNARVALP